MPHSGRTSKGRNYRSRPGHPNPDTTPRGSRSTGTTRSAARGGNRSSTASANNKGQMGNRKRGVGVTVPNPRKRLPRA